MINYIFQILSKTGLATLVLLSCFSAFSQEIDEKSLYKEFVIRVTDTEGNPISKAHIFGEKSGYLTKTDSSGYFRISVIPNSELLIESESYQSAVIQANSSEDVVLNKLPFLMDGKNKIHIPFGQTYKALVPNSTLTLNAAEIETAGNEVSISDLIKGYATGFMGDFNFRGMGQALVVIDGLVRPINTITIQEIEQITLLKDVNSSVLYGPLAENGVIWITTKRGQAYKRALNVMVEKGISIPVEIPKYLNSADYMELYNEARLNDGLGIRYTDIENYRNGNPYRYPDVNYYSSEFLKRYVNRTFLNVAFQGGNQNARYYSNLGWENKDDIIKPGEGQKSGNNRFNIRGNIDYNLNDFIKSHVDVLAFINIQRLPNGNFWNYAESYLPFYYSPLLPLNLLTSQELASTAKTIDNQYILGGTSLYQDNVYGDLYMGGYQQNIQRNTHFNTGIEFDLDTWVTGLSGAGNINFDFFNAYTQAVQDEYAVYEPEWNASDSIVSLTKIGEDKSTGTLNLINGDLYRNINYSFQLNYLREWNQLHHFNGLLLAYYNTLSKNNEKLSDKYSHLGLKLEYNYSLKYLLNFSAALSNSVKLPENNKIGFSPTFGAAWVISKESFWQENNLVNYLKLRLSGGVLQSDASIGFNLFRDAYYESNSYSWGDATGYSGNSTMVERIANPELSYEKTKNINFGFNSVLFDNQLTFEGDVFYYQKSGLVTQRTAYYPAYVSDFRYYENFGANEYSGYEFSLNYRKNIRDFQTDILLSFMHTTSSVKTIDEIWSEDYMYRAGKPVDAIFGLESLGLFDSPEKIESSPAQRFSAVQPGDIKYTDKNGDNQIDDNDQVEIGNSLPRYLLGLHLNFRYKKMGLNIWGDASLKYNKFLDGSYFWMDGDDKYSEVALSRWTPATASTATYPRLSSLANSNNFRYSDYWMYNASNFSLSLVQLSYDIISGEQNTFGLETLSLYVRGTNLLLISEKARERQIITGGVPAYRNLTAGIKLNF